MKAKTARRFLNKNEAKINSKKGSPSFRRRVALAKIAIGKLSGEKHFFSNTERYAQQYGR